MNERIEKAYAQRPKRWVFELSVAVIVTALIVWSATAVETSGTTQNGGKRPYALHFSALLWAPSSPFRWRSSPRPT